MKRNAYNHRKTRRLAKALGIPKPFAVGILESLWHVTATQRPRGDIGALTNQDIADEIEWEGDADVLVRALTEAGWLDESAEHRLIVHDWAEHCDNGVKQTKAVREHGFATDTPSQGRAKAEPACGPTDPASANPEGTPGVGPTGYGYGYGYGSGRGSAEGGAVRAAVDAVGAWSEAVRGHPLRTDEELDVARRVEAMPDALPWLPQAARDCQARGVKFKSVAYVMTPLLNRVDELRRERPAPPPTFDPAALYARCRSHMTFRGERVLKAAIGHNPGGGLLKGGKVWVPLDQLAEVKVDD